MYKLISQVMHNFMDAGVVVLMQPQILITIIIIIIIIFLKSPT
jgi:hypothetical protein